MSVTVSQTIQAPRARVWEIITDIANAPRTITAIKDLTVLERPATGLVGLKWTETRVMFGKEAQETMWISAAEDQRWYETTAQNHGAIYKSRLEIRDAEGGVELSMRFDATPTNLKARLMCAMFSLFAKTTEKALRQDLRDIKARAEG